MLDDFHFLRPYWLIAIIPLVTLAWYWIKRNQAAYGWQQAVDVELLAVLLDSGSAGSRSLLRNSLIAGLLLTCVGMAGPTWEKLPQNVEQRNDALVILLDLSLSMLAQDVKPSRIERARQKVTDILRLREEGLTALVAYAGDAHAVVPLTDDTATITNLLVALGPEMMPVPGSNPDHAITLAHELFANSGLFQGRILIITDGIDSINSVSKHRNFAFPISIIGIGTEQGGTIPLDKLRQAGKVLLTQEGNQIVALLDHQRLQEVANLSHGTYAPAQLGDNDILDVLNTRLPGEDETLDVEREFDTWYDQGHWLVLLLLIPCLIIFRRGIVFCLPLLGIGVLCGLIAMPTQIYANSGSGPTPDTFATTSASAVSDLWQSLWLNDDQRGRAALRYGEPEKAVTLFDDPQWRAAAHYRSGDYPSALNQYLVDPSSTGKYNQGNSYARLGEYETAIGAYDEVLATDPNHADAAFNKELVQRLLEEKQQAEQEQNQDQQSQANNEDSQEQQDQEQDQQQSENEQQSEDSEQQEQDSEQQDEQQQGEQQLAENQDQNSRDEKQEALEQWLRRVPDDPGGLLKRKFTHETKERLRRGEYENRQGDKIW